MFFIKTSAHLFGLLLIIFVPFEIYPYQQEITDFLFKAILTRIAGHFFSSPPVSPDISSDSCLFYLLFLLLLSVACCVALLLGFSDWYKAHSLKLNFLIKKIFSYYLALLLFKYGFDKVFKGQFYLPEPNILYTPFGQLDQDILYWSTLGTSYSYNLFLGGAEVLAASLILFNRTRATGLFISFFILINVVAINLCFDISVKLFSFFLLYLNLLCLFQYLVTFINIFICKKTTVQANHLVSFTFFKNRWINTGLKITVTLIIFLQSLYPYLMRRNFNDDLTPRPYLHGAYEVNTIINTQSAGEAEFPGIKRFFIHRAGYIIFQDEKEKMQDYKLEINTAESTMILTDYGLKSQTLKYTYTAKDSSLNLHYFYKDKEFLLQSKALNWRKLPALQKQFHLTMDESE